MNWQEFNPPRRLYVTVSLQRLGRRVSGPVTRAHFAPQAVKLLRAVPGNSRVLADVDSTQVELADFLQLLKEPGHQPLLEGSASESWASDTKAGPSLVTIEILQNSCEHLESGVQGSSFIKTSDRVWPKKNLEAMPLTESQGKGRPAAFSSKANTEEKPQSPPVQSREDLWKGIIIGGGNASPRRRRRKMAQYPKVDVFEEQGLEGKKIQPPKKPICRVERRHDLEIQTLKQEKMRNKRVKERGTWLRFLPDKSFLEQKQRELGSLLLGGISLLDKKKTQALELSTDGHHLLSGPREPGGNPRPLAQDDNNKEATRKWEKRKKRKLRLEWWDPTVWGDPVILKERKQSPRKTCSEAHSEPRKLSFPIGRLNC
ncbi:hypothetical protein ACRRTK_016660 [Alexandromys fortis]